jgi:excisionase family DNA binding protein
MGSLLTIAQAAERLQVSDATVYRLVANRRLGSIRVGRLVRISEADIERFLTHNRVAPSRAMMRGVFTPNPGYRQPSR